MVRMRIAEDGNHLYFWSKESIKAVPYKSFCVEEVSPELFNALMVLSQLDKHQETISSILYDILEKKGTWMN